MSRVIRIHLVNTPPCCRHLPLREKVSALGAHGRPGPIWARIVVHGMESDFVLVGASLVRRR